jgi:K+-sensing histidine kinase KdpD
MAQSSKNKSGGGMMDSTPLRKLCHDLSGPLTSIMINCEMLLEEDCSLEVRRRAETVLAEAMHINRLLHESRVHEAA